MKLFYFLIVIVNSEFIKNANINSCKNCIHYKPDYYTSKCNNFGIKNIVDDTVNYDYAEMCRTDELKCGVEGKYFEKDDFANLKILKNDIMNKYLLITLPISLYIVLFGLNYLILK